MSLRAGARLGPYEVVSALGAGGMGEVYRARDQRLDRDVAVKVLPESLSTDVEALSRFEREAKAVAALSHPNILAIHDFGNHDGVVYAVMELLEGGTLREALSAGPIPWQHAVSLALQIAKGLTAAHEKGIIHRDLKPENIFISRDGHLKILDFGLARHTRKHGDDDTNAITEAQHTEAGLVMGTAGYMSPEQARGLRVDSRSDIFSFGAILYELLSGKKAFTRGSVAETLSAILRDEPPELTDSASDVPPALASVVKHCLEKNADRRFQSARDLVAALTDLSIPVTSPPAPLGGIGIGRRSWMVAGVLTLIAVTSGSVLVIRNWEKRGQATIARASQEAKAKRIVVLPFENLGAPEDAYFAAGLTEEIINRLANLRGLSVISRTTAVGYDRKGKTVRQIGTDLDVAFVLEGAVRWEHGAGREGRVRITPQLIQVADDSHVWADRYDRATADIFAIQSDVAENVVRAMGVNLVPQEKAALASVSTRDMEAYDLYLRGRERAQMSSNRQGQEDAIRMFQAAVERDPRFSQALTQLAMAHLSIYFYHDRFRRPVNRTHVDAASDAVSRLTALEPGLAETHVARGFLTYWGLEDYPRALEEFKAALILQPTSNEARYGLAYILRRQGRWKEAAEQIAVLQELDPRNPDRSFNLAVTLELGGRYAEADRFFTLSASLEPQVGTAYGKRAWLQILWRGDVEGASSLLSEGSRIVGLRDDVHFLGYYTFRIALIKRDPAEAVRKLDGEKREAFSNQFIFRPIELLRGQAYASLGKNDVARRSFESARRRLEALVEQDPDNSRYHSALGIAYAGLGLREEALREAKRGVSLMPESKDLWLAMWRLEDLALVHAMLGQKDEAISQLDRILSKSREISAHALRLDPRWDPLRSSPGFQALLEKFTIPGPEQAQLAKGPRRGQKPG